MNTLDKLITYFERFPGVGGRQARRFAFFVLTLPPTEADELARLIGQLRESAAECRECFRFFTRNGNPEQVCSICSDRNRDRSKLMVVERDSDIVAIERSGVYNGLYFVLGGTVPLLSTPESSRLRGGALKAMVEKRASEEGLTEIILAFAVNPDGENTARYLENLLGQLVEEKDLKIMQLGRGLSTGSELEYADPETIKNAWRNRG